MLSHWHFFGFYVFITPHYTPIHPLDTSRHPPDTPRHPPDTLHTPFRHPSDTFKIPSTAILNFVSLYAFITPITPHTSPYTLQTYTDTQKRHRHPLYTIQTPSRCSPDTLQKLSRRPLKQFWMLSVFLTPNTPHTSPHTLQTYTDAPDTLCTLSRHPPDVLQTSFRNSQDAL